MPCINNTNGQPVPGRMGSCPIGSTWREPTGWFGRDQMSEEDVQLNWESMANRKPLMDKPDWMPDWGVDVGTIAAGVLGGGRNPGSKQALWQGIKNIGTRLKNKGGGVVNKVRGGGQPDLFGGPRILDRLKAIGIPSFSKFKELYSSVSGRKKLIALGITAPIATMIYQNSSQIFGGDAPVSKVDTDPSSPTYKGGREARAGRGPAPEQSQMQRLGALMKDPNWWYESMSGLPSDNRLMRIGQLMSHYGKPTEKMRAQAGTPQEKWAENEAAAAKIKADMLTAGGTAGDIYGKKSIADLTEDLLPDVKQMFGDSFWRLTDNPDMDDEAAMLSLASQVATNIKAITTRFPNKTPNEVRQLALKQLMKDRGLTQYGL